MIISAPALCAFAEQALSYAGMEADAARVVAEVLVEADLMGHDTHGVALLPGYVEELSGGTMRRTGQAEILRDHGAVALWDGHWLSGVLLVTKAIDKAMEKAKALGLGAVSIRRAHHTACLQAYLERGTREGFMIMIASSDPNSATVAPFGGLDRILGPDPIAVGIPTSGDAILIDMSSSITTNGMVARSAKQGAPLNGKWLQDSDGNLSDDPNVMSATRPGSMLLTGGHDHGQKGYGLALTVEALSQGLSGYGRHNADRRWSASVYIQAIDPAAFGGSDAYTDFTDRIVDLCRGSRPINDLKAVRLPGEMALARKRAALRHGITLRADVVETLHQLPGGTALGLL